MADTDIAKPPFNFKRAAQSFVPPIARRVISGEIGYFDAEDEILKLSASLPDRDYDYAFDLLARATTRYGAEGDRIAAAVRSYAVEAFKTGVPRQKISAEAMALDKNQILGWDAIRGILNEEFAKSRRQSA